MPKEKPRQARSLTGVLRSEGLNFTNAYSDYHLSPKRKAQLAGNHFELVLITDATRASASIQ